MMYFVVGVCGAIAGFIVSKILHDKKTQQMFLEVGDTAKAERALLLKSAEERQTMLDNRLSSMVEKNRLLKKEIYGIKNTIEKIDLKNSKKQKEREGKQIKEMEKYFMDFTKHVDSYYNPSLQELLEIRKSLESVDNKIKKMAVSNEALKEEVNTLRISNEQKYFETQEIIQQTRDDIGKRLDKNNLLTRPPQHIICGTLT